MKFFFPLTFEKKYSKVFLKSVHDFDIHTVKATTGFTLVFRKINI